MAINFSQRFVDIYINSQNENMIDIMQKSMHYVEKIEASDADKEFVFESLYAFKMVIAEPRGINMDEIYDKLQYIKSISHTDISNPEWVGVCTSSEDGIHITIDDSRNTTEEAKKKTLSHELVHAFSASIQVDAESGNHIYSKELTGFSDESATEAISMKMMRGLGYQYSDYNSPIDNRDADFITVAWTNNISTGYSNIVSYSDIMDKAFGPEFYYNKLQVSNANIDITDDPQFKQASDLIDDAFKSSKIESRLMLEHLLLDEVNKQYSEFDFDKLNKYIYEMKLFNKVEVAFNIKEASPEYEPNIFHSASEYQSAFEIINIYAKLNNITSDVEIAREMNPITRSDDCYNFLVGMSAIKQLNMPYNSEDIANMSCTKHGALYKLSIGGDSYITDAEIDKETGMIGISSVRNAREFGLLEKLDNLSLMFGSSKIEKDIDYMKMVGVDEISCIYTKTSNMIMENGANSDNKLVILSFAASSVGSEVMLKESLRNIDIEAVRDNHGNNIMHILATNQSTWAKDMTEILARTYPDAVEKLVNQPNKEGKTPGDVMRTLSNVGVMTALSDNYINNESRAEFTGVAFDRTKLEYIDKIKQLIDEKDVSTIRLLIEDGKADTIIDSAGNNVLHMYAKGEIGSVSISKILNSGVDIHAENDSQLTPIKQAVADGNIDTIRMLAKFDDNLEPAIFSCAWKMHFNTMFPDNERFAYPNGMEIFDALTKNGYNPNATLQSEQLTLLQIASGIGQSSPFLSGELTHYELVNRLLQDGANPFYSPTTQYESLRDFAAEKGDVKLFKMMVSAGADKEMLDIENSNLTPAEKALVTAMVDLRDNEISVDKTAHNENEKTDCRIKDVVSEDSKNKDDDVSFSIDD